MVMNRPLFYVVIGGVFCQAMLQHGPLSYGQTPRWKSFVEMHEFYTQMFERTPGFGASRLIPPEELKRYEMISDEHLARLENRPALKINGQLFSVKRQSLIGLDREDPIVFQSDTSEVLENSRIRYYETRETSTFETEAVKKLRSGRWVAYEETRDRSGYRVIGALKAKESCASCHQVPVDTLLGAFVFELEVIKPSSQVNVDVDNVPQAALQSQDINSVNRLLK